MSTSLPVSPTSEPPPAAAPVTPRPTDRDRARFEAIFDAHHGALGAYARRRAATAADADDVVADTFVTAWRRLDAVPDGEGTRPWLYAVAWRALGNRQRSRARRRRLQDRMATAAPTLSVVAATDDDPANERVRAALASLRPGDQELLRLLAWEGCTHAEIATTLGITANAVAIRLHRARGRLAAALEALEAQP